MGKWEPVKDGWMREIVVRNAIYVDVLDYPLEVGLERAAIENGGKTVGEVTDDAAAESHCAWVSEVGNSGDYPTWTYELAVGNHHHLAVNVVEEGEMADAFMEAVGEVSRDIGGGSARLLFSAIIKGLSDSGLLTFMVPEILDGAIIGDSDGAVNGENIWKEVGGARDMLEEAMKMYAENGIDQVMELLDYGGDECGTEPDND